MKTEMKKNINNEKFIVLFSLLRLDLMRIEHRIIATEQTIQFVIASTSIITKINHYFRSLFLSYDSQVFVVRLFSLVASHLCVYYYNFKSLCCFLLVNGFETNSAGICYNMKSC